MRLKIILKIIITAIVCTTAVSASVENDLFSGGPVYINWQKGYIISRGKGLIAFDNNGQPVDSVTNKVISLNRARKKSYDAAKETAIINMVEALKNLQIDPQNSYLDLIKSSEKVRKDISDKIYNNISYKESPLNFDSSMCEAKLSFGSLIESIPFEFPSDKFPVKAEIPISTPYSSLIVDCRDFTIKPMLLPSIYSDNGLEIYGKNFINSSYIAKRGMVSYCYSERQAKNNSRAGQFPYYAVAIKSIKNCPVISEKDVRRIFSSQKTINNLKKCKVILIINNEGR